MAEYRRSYCGLCHPRCGLLLEVESGQIVSVSACARAMRWNMPPMEASPGEMRGRQSAWFSGGTPLQDHLPQGCTPRYCKPKSRGLSLSWWTLAEYPKLRRRTSGCPSGLEQTRPLCWAGSMSLSRRGFTIKTSWRNGPWALKSSMRCFPPSQRAKQLGADRYPFFGFPGWEKNLEANRRLPREYMHPPNADRTSVAHTRDVFNAMLTGRPYPVKAAISVASNPIIALPDSFKTRDALKALDLYVVGEFFMTPSAALADFVFPICSTVETSELWLTEDFCVACPRGIDPLFERRNTYDFWRGLAIRLGQEEHWPWQTVDQAWDFMLSPLGMDFNKLLEQNGIFGRREYKNYEKYGFGTPSGKVELYSSIFQDLGNSPVPVYREVWELAGGDEVNDEDFPLVLMTGSRFMPMYHSEQRQIEAARKKRPDPVVTLNPKTASSLGLNQDEWVWVETRYGSILMRLKLSDRIDSRMADADHGWWFPERGEPGRDLFGAFKSNANVLCPDDPEVCSPEIGSWPHTGLPCRIRGQ